MSEHDGSTEGRYRRSGWRGPVFDDRADAACQLVDRLEKRRVRPDVVVSLSPDGDIVGRTVAEAFGVRLDFLAARPVFPPGDATVAIAAVSDGGVVWEDESLRPGFDIVDEYLEREIRHEHARAKVAVDRSREGRPTPPIDDLSALLVTDGVESRAPVIAAIQQLRRAGAGRVTIGAPVVAPDCEDRITEAASEVVCIERPLHFERLEQFYGTTDEGLETPEPRQRGAPVSID